MSQPYLSLEAEWHDAFWDAEDSATELPLMADFLSQFPGKGLEIGCGSGRLMLPLLEHGFAVEGLELSEDMLQIARSRAQQLGLEATFHLGDMTSWQPSHPYDALLAPAFTLQLAKDPKSTLQHWARMLRPGGGLYLTTFMPYAELLGELPENRWYFDREITLNDGRNARLETCHRLDRKASLLLREHRYSVVGNPKSSYRCQQRIRWIEHPQMLSLLAETGFDAVQHCVDFDPEQTLEHPDHRNSDGVLTYCCHRFPLS